MLSPLEKRLILALACLAWLVVVIILVVKDLGGGIPPAPTLPSLTSQSAKTPRARQINDVFSLTAFSQRKPATNLSNPFYPSQTQSPPPPPPKTRKVDLSYRGFFTTTHGENRAYVMVGDQLVVGGIGTKVVADLTIADIRLRSLSLKDPAARETVLPFNTKQTLEIPLP